MAAAYASLLSLMQTIHQIHLHPTLPVSFDEKQYESLHTKINLLIEFLETYSSGVGDDLKSQIRDEASHAEYTIEAFVKDYLKEFPLTLKKTPVILSSSTLDPIIEDLTSIIKETKKFEESAMGRIVDVDEQMPTSRIHDYSSSEENTMVGFDDELNKIIDMLTREQSSRQVITIVGMGGSGKTILAKNVYESKHIFQHFDSLAWVTITQEYDVRIILLGILSCLEEENEMKKNQNITLENLREKLHQSLWKRRYLIVMDDVWDMNVWDEVSMYFPIDNNGSRIIVTTRGLNVSTQFSSHEIKMNFLDEDESWNLFCQKTFPQGVCPSEFEEIGKKIVRSCKGLPLSIVVIGGLLVKSEGKRDYWESVANDVYSFINLGDDDRCVKILSLSYQQLPIHLKPCFLYVGAFPEDMKIRVSLIVNLWVLEGFIKQNGTKSLEEVGVEYLKDLISRNLILDHKRGRTGNHKHCKIHDILRDLCLREAQKEKFIYIPQVLGVDLVQGTISQSSTGIPQCRLVEGNHEGFGVDFLSSQSKLPRSLVYDLKFTWPVHIFKLLRILNIKREVEEYEDTDVVDISQLINSRSLGLNFCSESRFRFSSSMSLLWNLQILIINDDDMEYLTDVCEFWEMSQLKHLVAYRLHLPDPPRDVLVLENLQKLLGPRNFKFSEEVVKRIPNIRKLEVTYDNKLGDFEAPEDYCLQNIGRLHKLESLTLRTLFGSWPSNIFQHIAFPPSLKRLCLWCCDLDWENVTTIGSLPHLELLKMNYCSYQGSQGEPLDEQFHQLKHLGIQNGKGGFNGDWTVDETNFPCLEHLRLEDLHLEEDIFSDIGEISTLHTIELIQCSERLVLSAKEMHEEQENNGNGGLIIHVRLRREDEHLMSFASPNFRVKKLPTSTSSS